MHRCLGEDRGGRKLDAGILFRCRPVDRQEMAQRIERLEQIERTLSAEELQALGKLVRDLTGFIKLATGDKPDPVPDDLLLQARQLLGLAGI